MQPLVGKLTRVTARDSRHRPEIVLRQLFGAIIDERSPLDAQFLDAAQRNVIGATGMPFKAPIVRQALNDPEIYRALAPLWHTGESLLIKWNSGTNDITVYKSSRPNAEQIISLAPALISRMRHIFLSVLSWAGKLDQQGRHIIDLKSPSPGPHFFVNLLVGNRIGFEKPLQTTPKSVVDRLGRGSLRSHAATQVLATRWDLRPEENGFPANRQFYIVENGQQIFYSADPSDPNVVEAKAVHAQNYTTISYATKCGLRIQRLIFLLPYERGLPLTTEVQSISITNDSDFDRTLKLVVTGMFGPATPGALQEDVVYTTLAMQAGIFETADGRIAAISPDYNAAWNKEDVRFHSMILHVNGHATLPSEFSTDYNEFVGNGTLERPEGLCKLSNRLARKGPGFFALAADFKLAAGQTARADNFTGMVSAKLDPSWSQNSAADQIDRLLERYAKAGELDRALASVITFFDRYRSYLQVQTDNPTLDQYVNNNLPFQILYQTFLSRSFCQTQKGYREIGFREIQDLFASMPFFLAMGHQELVKILLKEWASQIYEFGYANHNFYWTGKEPGEFSDDALWFVQAVDIYLRHTGDFAFLDEHCSIAGTQSPRSRSIFETLQAIIRYSGEISIGKHGLPLLDKADWNDTLRLDYDFLTGPEKEKAYLEQVRHTGQADQPLKSNYSESVMNAFLLKVAIEATRRIAEQRGDAHYAEKLGAMSQRLHDDLQRHAWKGDFFARVLFNRYTDGRYTHLGAKGDGLSADPRLDGTYFLNSFSWAILANVATEDQIRTMLHILKTVLMTPHGLKLCSPVQYSKVSARGGSGEYFTGDRENGGVFKHANMMATAAMFKAANEVQDRRLAAELAQLAYDVIDKVLPFRSLADPFRLCGNPRFCTQYNNSETGENVGPLVSGTATWLWLTLMSAYGLKTTVSRLELSPILRETQRYLRLRLDTGQAAYEIEMIKPEGFYRVLDQKPRVTIDGETVDLPIVPLVKDRKTHHVRLVFEEQKR